MSSESPLCLLSGLSAGTAAASLTQMTGTTSRQDCQPCIWPDASMANVNASRGQLVCRDGCTARLTDRVKFLAFHPPFQHRRPCSLCTQVLQHTRLSAYKVAIKSAGHVELYSASLT